MRTARALAVVAVILAAAGFRLLPHIPNVTPVAAMALFAGTRLDDRRLAFLVPLAAMLVSDAVLGFSAITPFVYAGMAATVLAGFWLRRHPSLSAGAFAITASALVFFVVTNFGAWLTSGLYPRTAAGLWAAYWAGIPFFRNSLLGDFAYAALFFGTFAALERFWPALRGSASISAH